MKQTFLILSEQSTATMQGRECWSLDSEVFMEGRNRAAGRDVQSSGRFVDSHHLVQTYHMHNG